MFQPSISAYSTDSTAIAEFDCVVQGSFNAEVRRDLDATFSKLPLRILSEWTLKFRKYVGPRGDEHDPDHFPIQIRVETQRFMEEIVDRAGRFDAGESAPGHDERQ